MECSIVACTSMLNNNYFCAAGQLDKSTWLVVFIKYTFEFLVAACSQQSGDEDTSSSKSRSGVQQEARGTLKVFSRAENNVPRNKYRLCSNFGKYGVFQRDAHRISVVNVECSHWQFWTYSMLEFHISM